MKTHPEMNEQICGMLRTCGHLTEEYAALRIEELEQQLREVQEAAQAQSEAVQRDWLSPAEAEGLRQQLEVKRCAMLRELQERLKRQEAAHDAAEVAMAAASRCEALNAELIEQRDAERRFAKKAEVVLADAMDKLQAERQKRQSECERLRQQLQEVEKALAIAMDALEHCETAAPDLTGGVLDVIEARLTTEALARICECAREVCAR